MMRRSFAALLVLLLLFGGAGAQAAAYNGSGSVTRPANTTAYLTNKLYAANTGGNAVATSVTINGTLPGANFIVAARLFTNGTGATSAAFKVHLFAAGSAPTLTGLTDQSAYVGPYGADLPNYLGVLTCGSMNATNDGSAQFWSDCTMPLTTAQAGGIRFTGAGAGSVSTVLKAVFEVTTGYTPISGEVLTLYLAAYPFGN